MDNNTSASYINTFNSIKYIIGLQHNWQIVSQSNTGLAQPFNTTTEEVTEEKENIFLQAGFEAKIITDWLILRGSYIPLSYTHNYHRSIKVFNSDETKLENDSDSFGLLGTDNLTIGIGVELGKDMTLDVLITGPGVISYSRTSGKTADVSDGWLEGGYMLLVAEYMVRF